MYFLQDIGDLPDFELPEVLPDLPGIAQNLAFAQTSLDELPDIPFFEDSKSLSVLSPPLPVPQPRPPKQEQVEQKAGPPLPPIEAPPTLPPFFPEPELPEISMASKPVEASAPTARQPDEPGTKMFIYAHATTSSVRDHLLSTPCKFSSLHWLI